MALLVMSVQEYFLNRTNQLISSFNIPVVVFVRDGHDLFDLLLRAFHAVGAKNAVILVHREISVPIPIGLLEKNI